jgi:putative ABC transport system substrate-binding protein
VKRRDFITLLGVAGAWPVIARAQQPAMPVIGFLNSASPDLIAGRMRVFHRGLADTGYVEGQNVRVEYRWAENQYDRLPTMAADLVERHVNVITAIDGNASALAAKRATMSIPIVFGIGGDPVELGLVASLSRPGGNLTGATTLGLELGPKRLEIAHELAPAAKSVAVLVNPTNPGADILLKDIEAAGRIRGLALHVLRASTERDLVSALESLQPVRMAALIIGGAAFFNTRSKQIADLALRYGVLTVYQYREFALAGGLISYGGSLPDIFYLSGVYTGRVLKGEKPADLAVQQSTKVELIINLKTAKAIGIDVPPTLLARADEVIE